MPVEDIILRLKAVSEIKALGNTYNTLKQMEGAGIDVNKPLNQLDKRMKKLHVNTTKVARIFKPFRMELLSVMFGAQMVSGAIWGLFQPAMESMGMFELWGTMLQVLFLPILLELFPIFMSIFNFFVDLPEPIKLFLGAFLDLFSRIFYHQIFFI